MWTLKSDSSLDLAHRLLVGREYVVGLRDCDILIPNDMSISRKHAVVKVVHAESNLGNPEKPSVFHIKDVSKLGTQLANERIANGGEKNLGIGDTLVFGTAGISKYRVTCEPLVATTSCLATSSKKDVKRLVFRLGGHVVSEWCANCNLVIMSSLSVTIKVICALISQKPIVLPQYLEDVIKAVEGATKLPDPEDYLPVLTESQVNPVDISFTSNPNRKTLFKKKTFVFLSSTQHKKLHFALELGGGCTKLMTENTNKNGDQLIVADGTCVMLPDVASENTQTSKNWIQHIQNLLDRSNRRMISESEIGFAVLYCSTSTYCNPCQEITSLTSAIPAQSITQREASMMPSFQSQATVNQPARPMIEHMTDINAVRIKEEPASQPPIGDDIRIQKRIRVEEDTELVGRSTNSEQPMSYSAKKVKMEESTVINRFIGNTDAETDSIAVVSPTSVKVVDGARRRLPEKSEHVVEIDSMADSMELFASKLDVEHCNKIEMVSSLAVEKEKDSGPNRHLDKENKAVRSVVEFGKSSVDSQIVSADEILVGFLSSKAPAKMLLDTEYIVEAGVPSRLVVTEEQSLLYRKPGRIVPIRNEDSSSNVVIWKGVPIKNFKRFKKHGIVERFGLPQIIGGRDLVPHEAVTKLQEEYFQIGLDVATQRENVDSLSQELFNWEPPKKGTRVNRK